MVEVPTVVSFSSLQQQSVDRGDRGGLQGFPSGQGSQRSVVQIVEQQQHRFASRVHNWRLPLLLGRLRRLVLFGWSLVLLLICLALAVVVEKTRSEGLVEVKIVRLDRKTPAHLERRGILGFQPRLRVWKRLRARDHLRGDHVDAKARRVHQDDEAHAPVQNMTGVG